MGGEVRVPVPEEHSVRFTELAQGIRLTWRTHHQVGAPRDGSNFARVAALYPYESVAHHCRGYLDAAFEHLMMWADFVAPLKFHPDQVTAFTLRPSFTLARAALESSAHAVWLLSTPEPLECIRRHLSLTRWDISEHAKWEKEAARKAAVREQDAALVKRVAGVFDADQIQPPAGYLHVLQQACNTNTDLDLTAPEVEGIWRASSGAAHGKAWTDREFRRQVETAPPELPSAVFPDTGAMANAVDAAYQMTRIGALRYADYAGAPISELIEKARAWLLANGTLKEGAEDRLTNS